MRTLSLAFLGAGISGFLTVAAVLLTRHVADRPRAAVIALLVGAVLGFLGSGLAAAFAEARQPYRLRQSVALGPVEIERRAVAFYTRAGWAPMAASPGVLAFTRRTGPDILVAVALFVIGVIPGLVYLLFAGGTLATSIAVEPVSHASELEIVVSAQGDGGRRTANRFFNSLLDTASA